MKGIQVHCIALHSISAKAYTGIKFWVFMLPRRKGRGPVEMQLLLKSLDFIFNHGRENSSMDLPSDA